MILSEVVGCCYSNFKDAFDASRSSPSFILVISVGPIPFILNVPDDIASVSLIMFG